LSSDQLGIRLVAYGIDARAARTNLMLDLAAEGLSPSFLADLLGMHPGTAVKWVHAAGGDWTGYAPEARDDDPTTPRPEEWSRGISHTTRELRLRWRRRSWDGPFMAERQWPLPPGGFSTGGAIAGGDAVVDPVRRGVFLAVAAVLAMLFGVLGATAVQASCAPRPTMEESLARAQLVFVGTAVEVTNGGRWSTFSVEDVWKGQLDGDRVEIRGGARDGVGTTVDRKYDLGTLYLVFALAPPTDLRLLALYGDGVRWTDSNCSLTQPFTPSLAEARPSTARLIGGTSTPGPPRVGMVPPTTAPSTGMPAGAGESRQGWGLVIAVAVVGGVIAGVGAGRRRRGPPTSPASQPAPGS